MPRSQGTGRTAARSAGTGRFVKPSTARRNASATVVHAVRGASTAARATGRPAAGASSQTPRRGATPGGTITDDE